MNKGLKQSSFNYFNSGQKVADFSERNSRRFSSAVGAYWKRWTIALHITLHIALYSACCIVSVVLFSLFAVDSSGEDEETNADDAKQTM